MDALAVTLAPWETAALLGIAAALALLAGIAVQRLQRRVAQLTLEHDRCGQHLAEQDRALQRVARQRRELLANVSHDLRTPLASMQGYIELLLLRHGSLDPAEERNYLQTAARQGERLTRLVGDLFDLSRLEAGEQPLAPEDFVLAELAQDLMQKFAAEARQRGLRLEAPCDAPATLLRVHADLGLVARVLEGLVDNALRHTPAGGSVHLELGDDTAGGARIAVCDTGTGIAAEDLPGIFERYDRAARVRGPGHSEHAGLGLAIAQRIVELHGSRLEVRSTEGVGTQVSFVLPLAAPASTRRIAA